MPMFGTDSVGSAEVPPALTRGLAKRSSLNRTRGFDKNLMVEKSTTQHGLKWSV